MYSSTPAHDRSAALNVETLKCLDLPLLRRTDSSPIATIITKSMMLSSSKFSCSNPLLRTVQYYPSHDGVTNESPSVRISTSICDGLRTRWGSKKFPNAPSFASVPTIISRRCICLPMMSMEIAAFIPDLHASSAPGSTTSKMCRSVQ